MLLLTEWKEFGSLDFRKAKQLMARPLILDGRNLYRPKRMQQLGFTYYGVGRSQSA